MKIRISPFLLLCIMGGLAIASSTMSKNPVLPLFIRTLGVPVSTVGFIAAASTVVGVIVSFPAGILSDVFGRRRMLVAAAIVFATAPFLYLLVGSPGQLVAVRIYHGLATAILGPVAMAAVASSFDERRGERMAWYSSATMVGRFVAPFIGGALIFGTDFHWVFLVTGIFGVLALAAAIRLAFIRRMGESRIQSPKRDWGEFRKDLRTLLTHRGILATSLVEAVQYFAFGFLEVYFPIYLNEKVGFSAIEIGLLFTIQVIVAAFTKPVMGRLSDKYGRILMLVIGLIVGGITLATITHMTNYFLLAVLVGFFGLGLATVTASSAALVADLSRVSRHGSALGILSSVMDIGHSAGPMVGGLLVGAYNYQTAFGVVGGGMVVISLLFGFGMRSVSAVAGEKR
ncbi:MAG: MFS transporter [Dehalococcoidia bacterium]|nr:MFS transporter [Dehalococcoidia bacterium]